MMDKQVSIYSVDTGHFYSNHEKYLHRSNNKLRLEKNLIKDKIKEFEHFMKSSGLSEKDYLDAIKGSLNINSPEIAQYITSDFYDKYCKLKQLLSHKTGLITYTGNTLKKLLENKINQNISQNGKHHLRKLRANDISDKNIISVFDSFLTRTIGASPDEFTDHFMVVQVYYFDIIKDLIYYGFLYKGQKYIYFTSSAGQIRKKKCVFIKESIWKKCSKTLMCGLTVNGINKMGGCNPNKYLAYLALCSSATDVWNEFNIDKSIVIDDFETNVHGIYDFIDDVDYSITRTSGDVPIPHTDGCGMMLPIMGNNRMIRLPWIKGLLGKFDFIKFIKENECSPVIKDIYGKEHNIVDEDIQIIFLKSQFKMWKYYSSWDEYKQMYKKYKCSAGYTNLEPDNIPNATINYQMLQTLTDIKDKEIKEIVEYSNIKINNTCNSVINMQEMLGITPYNSNKTYLQMAIELYPDLMNDEFVKSKIREIKNSLVKRCKSGKLKIKGKYSFVLPDLYAACQYWFLGIENPDGLLQDGEIFCKLFKQDEKLDCLRSPHLYKEHAVRNNLACEKYNDRNQKLYEWFDTNAVYISTHDLISRILQLDVDGDMLLLVADKTFITVAERNMQGIVPLYYYMKKAGSTVLNNETIFKGLNAAFAGSNIGLYANNISKVWNSDIFLSGSESEKQQLIDIVKILTTEHNFLVDYAKTLYKLERTDEWNQKIIEHISGNVPHFFIYAKDKEDTQVEEANGSFVNKLDLFISNPRLNFRYLQLKKIDYRYMMNDPDIICKVKFYKNGKIDPVYTDPLIVKYMELCSNISYTMANEVFSHAHNELLSEQKLKYDLMYKNEIKRIKSQLSQFGYSEMEISDLLIKFLYYVKPNKHKAMYWMCYGEYAYRNLKRHFTVQKKEMQCVDCGDIFYTHKTIFCVKRCEACQKKYRKLYKKEHAKRKREQKNLEKNAM